jgi:hypothetical protein
MPKLSFKSGLQRIRRARADHVLRHRPSPFRFVLAESIDHVRPDHWDSLVTGHSVCLDRTFLKALEEAGPRNLKLHYAVAYDDGARPLVAVAAQSLVVDASLVPRSGTTSGTARLRDRGLTRVKQRVLVCGNLLGWGPQGVAIAPDVDRELAWQTVADALYRIRRQDVLFGKAGLVVIKDLGVAEADSHDPLTRYSYRRLATEPNMVLEIAPEWTTFDAYLAAMRSEYRAKVRKQIREVTEAGLQVERLDAASVRKRAREIHDLYLEVHEKQRLRLVTIPPEWIPALADRFGPAFRTRVLRRPSDDRLLGFVTSLRDRDGLIGYYIGFDKSAAAEGVPLYLRLLCALVEDAIETGARWVSLGRTALEPKAGLGALGTPLACYVRHRVPAMNLVLSALLRAAPEPALPPERRPFKPRKAD